jgi:hypothetical protein
VLIKVGIDSAKLPRSELRRQNGSSRRWDFCRELKYCR